MNNEIGGVISLTFQLEAEDGWPPVASESLPFRVLADGYECQVAPLFIKDLSVGDVISVVVEDGHVVGSWRHVRKSAHSTVWLLRLKSSNNIPEVLERLRGLGCNTVGLTEAGSYAIDIPATVEITTVDNVLSALDVNAVATAFPAMRHADS